MSLPASWTEVIDRLATVLGGSLEAEDWLREAVATRYRVESLRDLVRVDRQIAFQKASGVVLALEEVGVPDELVDADGELRFILYREGTLETADGWPGRRAHVALSFSRYFDGVVLEGPPWQISPTEADRPLLSEWSASADFG